MAREAPTSSATCSTSSACPTRRTSAPRPTPDKRAQANARWGEISAARSAERESVETSLAHFRANIRRARASAGPIKSARSILSSREIPTSIAPSRAATAKIMARTTKKYTRPMRTVTGSSASEARREVFLVKTLNRTLQRHHTLRRHHRGSLEQTCAPPTPQLPVKYSQDQSVRCIQRCHRKHTDS